MGRLHASWQITWQCTVFLCLWGALYAPRLVPVVSSSRLAGRLNSPAGRLYIDVTAAVTIVVAAWVMVRFVDRRALSSLGFGRAHIVREVSAGLTLGGGMMAACVATLWVVGYAVREPMPAIHPSLLIVAATSMFANTVAQEVLVRGYIQQTIQRHSSATAALLISSVLFMLLHVGALRGAILPSVNLFLAGLLLALGYVFTSNLWLPIALHFAWNFLQGPLLGLTVSGQSVDSGWRVFTLAGPTVMTVARLARKAD